jgi:hypothetical protein
MNNIHIPSEHEPAEADDRSPLSLSSQLEHARRRRVEPMSVR